MREAIPLKVALQALFSWAFETYYLLRWARHHARTARLVAGLATGFWILALTSAFSFGSRGTSHSAAAHLTRHQLRASNASITSRMAPAGAVRASPTRPQLFAAASVFERHWQHDTTWLTQGRYCTIGGKHITAGDSCTYRAGAISVSVNYDNFHAASFFLAAYDSGDGLGNRNPGQKRYWTFMASLIPTRSPLLGCRTISPTSNGASAVVCMYRVKSYWSGLAKAWRHRALVYWFQHPDAGGDLGHVELDDFNLGYASECLAKKHCAISPIHAP